MDAKLFFDVVRAALGIKDANAVAGYNAILAEAQRRKVPLAWLAYMLATAFWETAGTLQPVAEAYWVKNAEAWRKANLRYWPYYGRGYVQLTWDFNYKKATDYFRHVLGIEVDFVKNPDLVMKAEYAAIIMFVGMTEGWFTGKDLGDYIDNIDEGDVEDMREFTNARHIINGTDKADKIGQHALVFERALKAAGYH